MHYGWSSPYLPVLLSGTYIFTIQSEEASWLAIMPALGVIIGSILSHFIINVLGRKSLILLISAPFVVTWLMIGLARTSVLFHVARFTAGMADGLTFIVVPIFLGEIAEPKIRGMLSSSCPTAVVMATLLMNIFGRYMSIPTTAFVAAVFPLASLCIFMWIPESPYFLLMKGRNDEAKVCLKRFRGTDNVEKEFERVKSAVQDQNENAGKFLELFTIPSNRKALFIALGTRSVQLLTGIHAITFYCKTIFDESGDFLAPSIATIIFHAVQLFMSIIASFVVDISGRRPLLIMSVTGAAITLFANGCFLYVKHCTEVDVSNLTFLPIVCLLCFIIVFAVGLQTIPMLLLSELFPTNVKGFALCIAGVFFGIVSSGVSKFFHFTNENYGMHVPFFAFAACSVVGLGFIVFFVPETKGHSLEDIQNCLKNKESQR